MTYKHYISSFLLLDFSVSIPHNWIFNRWYFLMKCLPSHSHHPDWKHHVRFLYPLRVRQSYCRGGRILRDTLYLIPFQFPEKHIREKSTFASSLLVSTVILISPIQGVGNVRWIFWVLKGLLMLQRFGVEATKATLLVVSTRPLVTLQLYMQLKQFLSGLLWFHTLLSIRTCMMTVSGPRHAQIGPINQLNITVIEYAEEKRESEVSIYFWYIYYLCLFWQDTFCSSTKQTSNSQKASRSMGMENYLREAIWRDKCKLKWLRSF